MFFMGSMRERITCRHQSSRSFPACGRVVIPELLKLFLKKVSMYGLQVLTEQIAQPEALFRLQILFAFEQQPARFLQHGHAALAGYAARFSGTDFVQRLVSFSLLCENDQGCEAPPSISRE